MKFQAAKQKVSKSRFSVTDFIESFIVSQDVSITSRNTYLNALKQFGAWCKEKKVKQPTRETILSYKFWLDTKQLSSFTKATYMVVVRRFFLWAEDAELYPNIARGVKGVKRQLKNHQKDSLTIEGVKKLLSLIDQTSLKGIRDYALINILVRTGLRLKELASATIQDLEIQIQQEKALLWVHGKGRSGKDEFVMITQEALSPLMKYLQMRTIKSEREPLFASSSGRNYGKSISIFSLSRLIKGYLRKGGFHHKRVTAHSLRHTFGVLAMQAGASLYEVQLAMRHTAPTTTQLYLGDIERIKRLEASPERKISQILDI